MQLYKVHLGICFAAILGLAPPLKSSRVSQHRASPARVQALGSGLFLSPQPSTFPVICARGMATARCTSWQVPDGSLFAGMAQPWPFTCQKHRIKPQGTSLTNISHSKLSREPSAQPTNLCSTSQVVHRSSLLLLLQPQHIIAGTESATSMQHTYTTWLNG